LTKLIGKSKSNVTFHTSKFAYCSWFPRHG